MTANQNVFSDVEFTKWAYLEELKLEERFLINKYFSKEGKTIEAGTGGGRILIEMQKLGFTSLSGFDCATEMIEVAKQRGGKNGISFEVQDATSLPYEDGSFDQAIYLQQIICFIQDDLGRLNAFKEAHRILKKGGYILFSFLCFDCRTRNMGYLPYLKYLFFLRKIVGTNKTIQSIPWLKHHGKPNWSALLDKGPYTYWYKIEEICQICQKVGFEVVALGSEAQLKQGEITASSAEILKKPLDGMFYVVCCKK
ncbi:MULTISPECIES: methyltransferase domain-containing protein [unclassified Microcoleus]|uniref:methyltransferase domain-containing protein n=1 Tax=unclassified Microcoleus TaxID=2642155 RepID=UPI002FCEAECF